MPQKRPKRSRLGAAEPLVHFRGASNYLLNDNGLEFTANKVREWLKRVEVKSLFIQPGSPWEHGYIESSNGKFRDELLDRELIDALLEVKVLIERWRSCFNTDRPPNRYTRSLASATTQQENGASPEVNPSLN